MTTAVGGYPFYGIKLGILMLDTKVARIPGDVGNAHTYDYPVLYKVVKGATGDKILRPDRDPSLVSLFTDAAMELVNLGCKAITTSCGYLAMFQRELAANIPVPVFTSALMQAAFVYPMLKPDQKVGMIVAMKDMVTDRDLEALGISHIPRAIIGMDDSCFMKALNAGRTDYDVDQFRSEMVAAAETLVRENPDVGAIVYDCTNMGPFSADIKEKVGLPVFDFPSLADYVVSTLTPKRYPFNGAM